MGVGGSVDLKLDTSALGKSTDTVFGGDELRWKVGSKIDNKPTKISISSIEYLMDPFNDFWFDPCMDAEDAGELFFLHSTLLRQSCVSMAETDQDFMGSNPFLPSHYGAAAERRTRYREVLGSKLACATWIFP